MSDRLATWMREGVHVRDTNGDEARERFAALFVENAVGRALSRIAAGAEVIEAFEDEGMRPRRTIKVMRNPHVPEKRRRERKGWLYRELKAR